MKVILLIPAIFIFLACSNTWHGVKQDSSNAYEWSKQKIHEATE